PPASVVISAHRQSTSQARARRRPRARRRAASSRSAGRGSSLDNRAFPSPRRGARPCRCPSPIDIPARCGRSSPSAASRGRRTSARSASRAAVLRLAEVADRVDGERGLAALGAVTAREEHRVELETPAAERAIEEVALEVEGLDLGHEEVAPLPQRKTVEAPDLAPLL